MCKGNRHPFRNSNVLQKGEQVSEKGEPVSPLKVAFVVRGKPLSSLALCTINSRKSGVARCLDTLGIVSSDLTLRKPVILAQVSCTSSPGDLLFCIRPCGERGCWQLRDSNAGGAKAGYGDTTVAVVSPARVGALCPIGNITSRASSSIVGGFFVGLASLSWRSGSCPCSCSGGGIRRSL